MTTSDSKIFCLSYDMVFQNGVLLPLKWTFFNVKCIVVTEVEKKTLVRPQLEYSAPTWNPYHNLQSQEVEKVKRTAAMWTRRRRPSVAVLSVGDVLDELEWPSLEARRKQSALTFFCKIHSGTVSLDKDKYLTPAPNLQRTRASHDSQYTIYFAYSDALKNLFFPRTIPLWNSLPSSVVSSKTTEEFK